ncbi:Peptidyl-prolyl cis-trans isomerase A [Thalassocella blandensis]|nr:Peptidyl-prolyl cis-trans isomerase A [Thalassocella blandensis]
MTILHRIKRIGFLLIICCLFSPAAFATETATSSNANTSANEAKTSETKPAKNSTPADKSASAVKKDSTKTTKPADGNPKVVFETSSGKMIIELFPKKAPITVKNFLQYVDSGFYNGTIFHRVVPGFVVQGGGFTFDFQRKETQDPIKNESNNGLKNLQTTLSMARTNAVDSATSQFFINLVDNPFLDANNAKAGYAVFGKVIEGFEVAKKIEKEPRGLHRAHPEAPNYAVIVEKAYRMK